jgi:hypothetical protein
MKPLVQMAGKIFPDVPDILDLEMSSDARTVFKIFAAPLRAGRPVVGPPGVPVDRVEILRKAFDQALRDSALLADAKKQQLEPAPLPAEEVARTQREILAQPERIVRAYKEALEIQ